MSTGTPQGEHEDLKERVVRVETQIEDLQKRQGILEGKWEALVGLLTAQNLAFEKFRTEVTTGLMKQFADMTMFFQSHVKSNEDRAKETDGRLTAIERILQDNGTFRSQFGRAVTWVIGLLGVVTAALLLDALRRWK